MYLVIWGHQTISSPLPPQKRKKVKKKIMCFIRLLRNIADFGELRQLFDVLLLCEWTKTASRCLVGIGKHVL